MNNPFREPSLGGAPGKLSLTRIAFAASLFVLLAGYLMGRPVEWPFVTLVAALGGIKGFQRFGER